MGMGRFGQVLTPLLVTWMVALGWTGAHIFLALGLAPVIAAIAVLALRASAVRSADEPVRVAG